jgi:hypothetical protein
MVYRNWTPTDMCVPINPAGCGVAVCIPFDSKVCEYSHVDVFFFWELMETGGTVSDELEMWP